MVEALGPPKKILFFRLSSLGDVVLATSVLESMNDASEVDWVVAKEFAPLLRGHPRLHRIWEFDRATGFAGWFDLCLQLWNEGYEQVFDLHRSLRTIVARLLFSTWSIRDRRATFCWNAISKPRLSRYGYFCLKALWPVSLRPKHMIEVFRDAVGGTYSKKPCLRHLLVDAQSPLLQGNEWARQPYVCVMPASAWAGKCWPVESYLELLQKLDVLAVILGTNKDVESLRLLELARAARVRVVSGIGKWNLRETASVLSGAVAYLGNDTGLAHLAEAVGTRAFVIFGPTVPDMGFGPWRPESCSFGQALWCRPCGKDGRFCFRQFDKYACLKRLKPVGIYPVIAQALGTMLVEKG